MAWALQVQMLALDGVLPPTFVQLTGCSHSCVLVCVGPWSVVSRGETQIWLGDLRVVCRFGVFRALALPFGASGSVVHFLRVSTSFTFIDVTALLLAWSFFDFTCICCTEEEKNTSFYTDSGDEVAPFTQQFKTLGGILISRVEALL